MESDPYRDPDPFVVFTPRLGRFVLVELWGAVVGVAVAALTLGALGAVTRLWFWSTLGAGLVVVAVGAVFLRRNRKVVIGDTWMTGPEEGSFEPITILFATLDGSSTGIQKRTMRIRSLSAREITVNTAWYAPEEIDEIKRLVRDRASENGAAGTLSW